MKKLIVRRLAVYVPTVLLVTFIVFSLSNLSNLNPVAALLGEHEYTKELAEAYRKDLGLDRPFLVRYFRWLGNIAQGDLGRSIRTGSSMSEELVQRYQVTLELALGSILVTMLIAVPIGIYSALRPRSAGDYLGTVFAISGVAMPNFFMGILLIYAFAVVLGWLPSNGYVEPWDNPVENLRLMVMPILTLGTAGAASVMRQTRSAMLEVLREDYVRTAHAKGLSGRIVLVRHALKNGLIPVVTVVGLRLVQMLEGSAIVETIFSLPGMGQFAVHGVQNMDVVAIQTSILVFASIIIVVNLLVDLLYGYLDPRVRYT
ncbi:MAG: ABC transporter permease [Chloroflexi bacterium]|nr:ABC transporter permease [Chloroflexota bacterium]